MSKECRYICQRAANAIMSEVGPYRTSTDALLGINQFLDEFLIQLLVDCQSLDLSRIKSSVFRLIPSTLGKNAIVEAELEVKTFAEVEYIDYEIYEKMRTLGQTVEQPFPTKKCLSYLRDKCFEYSTLADKDDQQIRSTEKECQDIIISSIVAVYVTTVLEHIAEYILTAVALTAEIEETELVQIKELFWTLVDDLQVGMVFQSMDLRDKMEKRTFAHDYVSRSMNFTPQGILRGSTYDMNPSSCYFGEMSLDRLDLQCAGEDETTSSNRLGSYTSHSNYSVATSNGRRSASQMTVNASNDSSKKAYKVFKNDYEGGINSLSLYDPDSSSMNFDELIRSGNTMRVSLTPNRLKSIEVKDQMLDDNSIPSKSAWKRRSSSVPRMSGRSSGFQPPTPSPSCLQLPSSLVTASSIVTKTGNGYAATLYDVDLKDYTSTRRSQSQSKISRGKPSKPKTTNHDTQLQSHIDTSKYPPVDTTPELIGKTLPTPTSSTSSKQSKNNHFGSLDTKLALSSSSIAKTVSTNTISETNSLDSVTPQEATLIGLTLDSTPTTAPILTKTSAENIVNVSIKPMSRQSSLNNRDTLRYQDEKGGVLSDQQKTVSSVDDNPTAPSDDTDSRSTLPYINKRLDLTQSKALVNCAGHPQTPSCSTGGIGEENVQGQDFSPGAALETGLPQHTDLSDKKSDFSPKYVSTPTTPPRRPPLHTINGDGYVDSTHQNQDKHISRCTTVSGTVGNTIKQLDLAMKQKASSTSIRYHCREENQRTPGPISSLTTSVEADPSIDPKPVTRQQHLNSLSTIQQKTASRRSAVLDKVLQFERAYSMDDAAQRRASSYIPRRERFMYLQNEISALERPLGKTTATAVSTPHGYYRYGLRTGASAAIIAAAARFETGNSVAIQTDSSAQQQDKREMGDDSIGATSSATVMNDTRSSRFLKKPINTSSNSLDGDNERLLLETDWHHTQEQEGTVVAWLLGEAGKVS